MVSLLTIKTDYITNINLLNQMTTAEKLSKIQIEFKAKKSRFNSFGKYCLLYTSPSPRDRTRSRMPSSA